MYPVACGSNDRKRGVMNQDTVYPHGLVLIVDDQKNWRETLGELLGADSHQVRTSASLAEARTLLASEDFDVAIVDIRLLDDRRYDIQGLKILEEVRKSGLRTRVLVLTGYAPPGTEARVLEIGADVFAFKSPPEGLDIVAFREVIRKLVQEARRVHP